ncbi:MFS transporter [Rhodococcoides yunnanense]|uniref:MFS transporter n=1 Tax=Rhodococcoides yunnanense TaxID=278209 RepID=UPI000933DF6B|nr:MFS transporter [Rhodococcus yunnanensis]
MTEKTTSPPRAAVGIGLIVVLACGAVSALMQLYLVIPMSPRLRERYGMSDATTAWMLATFGLAFGLGNLFFGPYSDRRDRRSVMAVGLVGAAGAALTAGHAGSALVLFLARGVGGFFTAAFAAVALAYLGEVLEPRLRPIGLAIVSGCFLLAGIAGQGLGLAGVRSVGIGVVFTASAVPLVVVAVLVLRLPRARNTVAARSSAEQLRSAARLVRIPAISASYLAAVTLLLAFVGLYSGISISSEQVLGTGDLLDLYLLRLVGIPGILLGIFGGPLIRRWGSARVGLLALATASAGVALVATATSVLTVAVWSAVFMIGLGLAVPSVVATVSAAADSDRGVAMAGYGFLIGIGACTAPLLAAALAPAGFPVLCLTLAAVLAAAAAVFGYRTRAG